MKSKSHFSGTIVLATALSLVGTTLNAQVPTNFTGVATTIYDSGAIAPGLVFVASCGQPGDKGPFFLQIMNNDGTPRAFKATGNLAPGNDFYAYDLKVLPDGRLFSAQFTNWYSCLGGGSVQDQILDENLDPMETVAMGNGYQAESHDFELLPNGHVLLMGYYTTLTDLRSVLPGAPPRAEVSGTIVQELDADRKVVWQWRAWDHLTWNQFSGWGTNCGSVIAGLQANALRLDPGDGNLLLATGSEQMKINRQSGDVMWRLGGAFNQFSFAGVTTQEGLRQLAGNDFHRLANGNYILLNNGAADGSRTSQVHEYQLDETNKVATHIWQYIPSNTIPTSTRGSVQRLPNGNTFIGWGTSASGQNPECTEVTPDGTKVFELSFTNSLVDSYRAFRFPYPPSAQKTQNTQYGLRALNTYVFTTTGVSLELSGVESAEYNSLTVAREPYAPLNPRFSSWPPRLLPVRVSTSPWFLYSLSGFIYFDPAVLSLSDPASLTVYWRPTPGDGAFSALPTSYDEATGLQADLLDTGGLGEFAFGVADLMEAAFEPLLLEPESLPPPPVTGAVTRAPGLVQPGQSYAVNQQLPVSLAWCPKGFADYYYLQIATNADFTGLVDDQPYLTETHYTFASARTNMTYFWRVCTIYSYLDPTQDVLSDWATNAFTTVPSAIHVTAPNGGETLCKGQAVFVQWDDNLNENVAIDLYKAGSFVTTIAASISSTVIYNWQLDSSLAPGAEYSLKIRSTTNSALFDTSDQPFSIIDRPVLGPGSLTMLSDRRVRLNLSVPGAPQATVFASTNLSSWELLQTVPLTDGAAVFTDDSAPTNRARFYRLSVP